jgi:hypothetical protein
MMVCSPADIEGRPAEPEIVSASGISRHAILRNISTTYAACTYRPRQLRLGFCFQKVRIAAQASKFLHCANVAASRRNEWVVPRIALESMGKGRFDGESSSIAYAKLASSQRCDNHA